MVVLTAVYCFRMSLDPLSTMNVGVIMLTPFVSRGIGFGKNERKEAFVGGSADVTSVTFEMSCTSAPAMCGAYNRPGPSMTTRLLQ